MDSDSEKPKLETTNVPPPPAEPVYIDADKIPDSDEISIDFLNLIVKNDLRYLEFDENLSIYSLDGDEVGTFFISVKPFVYKRENCFKVVVKSSTLLEDNTFKTEINALVDLDLNTIEQECIENHLLPNGEQVETKITLVLNDEANEYILTKKEKDKKEIKKSVVRIRTSLMDGYISESSNILLQRLMIQLNRFDEITLFTFDSNLNPVKVSYRPLDNRFIKLDDEEIEIRGVERKMNSYSDVPTIWHVYFSSDGHMINRVQIGFQAIIRATKPPPKIDIDEYMPKITIPKKELNWEEDMQMKSKYIDRKEELKNDYDQYLKDHPEVKSLMADFMQSILIAKPNDVVSYSARYFAPYSAHTKPNQFYPSYAKTINIPKHQEPN